MCPIPGLSELHVDATKLDDPTIFQMLVMKTKAQQIELSQQIGPSFPLT